MVKQIDPPMPLPSLAVSNKCEVALYQRWLLGPSHWVAAASFYLKKIRQKLAYRTGPYGNRFCPDAITNCLKKTALSNLPPDWTLPVSVLEKNQPTQHQHPNAIFLASSVLAVQNGQINWDSTLSDPEDIEFLHRWIWIPRLLAQNKMDLAGIESWCVAQMESWCAQFLDGVTGNIKTNTPHHYLIWQSYSVAERLANAVRFFQATQQQPSQEISLALQLFATHLTNHLEYKRPEHCGNHTVNNARGLYLWGVASANTSLQQLAVAILRHDLPFLLTADGFLREGSSHYQLLFTRWLLDMHDFALLANDQPMITLLAAALTKIVPASAFFATQEPDCQIGPLPLFGDISPDCPPAESKGVLTAHNATPFAKPGNEHVSMVIQSHTKSGWWSCTNLHQQVFVRLDSEAPPAHAGHHHNDLLHFCLFYRGKAVLVDAGRKDYSPLGEWSLTGVAAMAHNTVLVDNLPCVPDQWRRFPGQYAKANNGLQTTTKEPDLCCCLMSSDGFKRIPGVTTVFRELSIAPKTFGIKDLFQGKGSHTIATVFHWGPDVKLTGQGANWQINSQGQQGKFVINAPPDFAAQKIGKTGDSISSVVEAYGKSVPATTLLVMGRACFPVEITYNIIWEK